MRMNPKRTQMSETTVAQQNIVLVCLMTYSGAFSAMMTAWSFEFEKKAKRKPEKTESTQLVGNVAYHTVIGTAGGTFATLLSLLGVYGIFRYAR